MAVSARFDDLISARGWRFSGFDRAVVATEPDQVPGVLNEIEAAVAGGSWAAGYLSYEAAPGLDPALVVRPPGPDDRLEGLPLAWFGIFTGRESVAIPEPRIERPAPYHVSVWSPGVDRDEYETAIAAIREHIAAGDTYQVNYTFRLRSSFSGEAEELYRDLALVQGGAYSAFIDTGRYEMVSASPELFFEIEDDVIRVRPMKGTARRGRWPEEDARMAAELAASAKERAENLMIVDLLRNDLGRIAEFGTVDVARLFEVERYETVWQLTSSVSARLREDVSLTDLIRALFPSGSVTGTPKARTMEIIAGLERSRRGAYCGAIGYLAPPGSSGPRARFSVGIRTAVIDREEGIAEYGVGGGITWDSEASGEYEEARAKASLLTARRPDFDLLETLRFDADEGWLWLSEHLDRMGESADFFGFPWDRDVAATALREAVASVEGTVRVRLTWNRSGTPDVSVAPLDEESDAPVPIVVCTHPVASHDVFLFHKTTNRRAYDQRLERYPGIAEVLLVNEREEVTESTTSNVLVQLDGVWWTPPLDSGCLPGVHRRALLAAGEVRERPIRIEDLSVATGVALVNSVRGRRPAVIVPAPEDRGGD